MWKTGYASIVHEVNMNCINPVIRGFYPDPSICFANGFYYLVCSSFEYFPGLPLFKSEDLVHWKSCGHCLTRQSQLDLRGVEASGGLFAPTIRYNPKTKRFYVVVTNVSGNYGNFFVYTDNIESGSWSEPVRIARGGIDPSLLFDEDATYFLSNGTDDFGEEGISLCQIDIETGAVLSKAKCISRGCGGRYLEGPHLYHIGEWYYLMVAEGGTEYGHMECMLRSKDIWGPYQACPHNPILTNRNLGGYLHQASGHADLVESPEGQWFMVHLGFRQIDRWLPFHTLGRETYLEPVFWKDDWPLVASDGTARSHWQLSNINGKTKCVLCEEPQYPSFEWKLEKDCACYLRLPDFSAYKFTDNAVSLRADEQLGSVQTVSFVGMRQTEHKGTMTVCVDVSELKENEEAGISAYLTEKDHYVISVNKKENVCRVSARLVIDGMEIKGKSLELRGNKATLRIDCQNLFYNLLVKNDEGTFVSLQSAHSKFLSSEVACGFTGTVLALFCASTSTTVNSERGWATFSESVKD
ncbi:MAG TPA: glycoside hydrolase family 43 protein [Treponema sp.]|nr:glycoside hydrolase family 43 protein [Treponema sp.]